MKSYYVRRSHNIVTRGHDIVSHGNDILPCGHKLIHVYIVHVPSGVQYLVKKHVVKIIFLISQVLNQDLRCWHSKVGTVSLRRFFCASKTNVKNNR